MTNNDENPIDSLSKYIVAGFGVLTAVFVFLGIQGTLLERLFRNNGATSAHALKWILVGASVIALAASASKLVGKPTSSAKYTYIPPVMLPLGYVALLAGAWLAVDAGVASYSDQEEQPDVSATLVNLAERSNEPATQAAGVKVSAHALGLAVDEKLRVRVVAYPATTSMYTIWASCENYAEIAEVARDSRGASPREAPLSAREVPGARTLHLGESGPDARGGADRELVLGAPADAGFLCASAAVIDGRQFLGIDVLREDLRRAAVVVDLTALRAEAPTPSATPTAPSANE